MDDQHHNNAHEQNHSHEHENNSNNQSNMKDDFKEHLDGAMGTFKEMKNPGKFCIKTEFMNAIEILKLNEKKMQEVATSKTAAIAALLFILAGIVAMSLGQYFMFSWLRPSVGYLLLSMAYNLVGVIVGIFAINFVANQFFKGKGNFGQLFKVMGYAYIAVIPFVLVAVSPVLMSILSLVVGIWMIVVSFKTMAVIKKTNVLNTIFTFLIVGVAFAIISTVIVRVFGLGYGFGVGSYGGYGGYGGYDTEIDSVSDALDALRDLGY